MRTHYLLINCSGGDWSKVNPYIISRHWTLSGARRAFRKNNPWLFNRRFAERYGYQNAGTFDRIVFVDENGDWRQINAWDEEE